ncbi:hypothetical protein CWS02_14025 [Enterobacter sp. EA-1]|nr:hypothetical protein CWS02_14025 [Enterobacter sp. EA-1]
MPPSAAEAMRTLQTIHAFQLQRDLTTPDDTLRWVLTGAVHYPELQPSVPELPQPDACTGR